jgi:hypothetical protein
MADVRCPMCGKHNPPETVICKFCQARLEPLIAPSPSDNDDLSTPENNPESASLESGILPDWIDDLRAEDEAPQEQTDKFYPGDISEDWTVEDEGRLSSAFPASPEDDPGPDQDWLSRLVGDEPAQAEQERPDEPQDTPVSTPSVFFGMDELLGEEGSSDWLAEFQSSSLGLEDPSDSPQADETPLNTSQDSERPHWLEMIRAQQQRESEAGEAPTPPESASPERDEPFSAEPPTQGVNPDWLSDIGIDEDGDDFSIDSKDLPDWMTESDPLQPKESPAASEAIPEWVNESELPEQTTNPHSEGDLPDWLTSVEETPADAIRTPTQELPNWLSETSAQDLDHSGLPEPVESEEEQAPASNEEGGLPDWLTKLDASGVYQPAGSDSPAFILEDEQQVEASDPAWAGDDPGGEAPGGEAPEREVPEGESELSAVPDWLAQISAMEEHPETGAPIDEEIEPDLAEAQLPSWLQAMRPVESAALTAPAAAGEGSAVEQAGPLAGLAGVLSAEPEFIHLSKPKSSLVKLQVSDNQQSHITLLENLLAEEGQSKPVTTRSAISSQYFLRLLIALVVLVSVILPLWLNRELLPMPAPAGVPNEVYDFGRLIGGLTTDIPVLVAFDYEPGFSGELDATATAILSEMAGRGIHLTAISTNPTGPLLAERFKIARLSDSTASFVNLGYIPGGAAGMLAFAQTPRAVVPFDLHGARVWETTPLSAVSALADFGAVLVLTENPDTARSWIEQAQPFLESAGKPLLMVLSAQAEPMVRPYYETSPRQVSGMISGLAGGAAYESISGNIGVSRQYWDAFGMGSISAVGIILAGALVSLVMALLSKPEDKEVEGVL